MTCTVSAQNRSTPARGSVVPLAAVWEEFAQTGSPAARESLIVAYAPLVAAIAAHVGTQLPASVERADLVSLGMFGLIDAIDKFDPQRQVKFETYASTRVRGAILDGLRASDWAPRSVRARARQVERAVDELEATLHRTPTRQKIAAHLGIAPGLVIEAQARAARATVLPLEDLVANDPAAYGDAGSRRDPEADVLEHETVAELEHCIRDLSERDRTVVRMYYYEGCTLSQIGEALGVTESRVSQMRSGIVAALRSAMMQRGHF